MAASTDPTPVNTARLALRGKRQTLIIAINSEAEAAEELAQVLRDHDPGHPDAVAAKLAHDNAVAALNTARGEERTARTAVKTAIDAWMKDGSTVIDPTADVARLQADNPMVLLPVRVETRFQGPPLTLKVRIYPDEIFLDIHERALAPDEVKAAIAYYQDLDLSPRDAERLRWRDLAGRFGANRAAYIARAMRPALPRDGDVYNPKVCDALWLGEEFNDPLEFPPLLRRPDLWTRPGEAVLPDRWVVAAYRGGKVIKTKFGATIPEPLAMTDDPGGSDTTIDGFAVDQDLLWTVDYATAEQNGMAVTFTLADDPDLAKGYDRLVVVGVKSSMLPFENVAGREPLDAPTHLEKLLDAHHYARGLAVVPQGTATNNTEGSPTAYPPDDPFFDNSFDAERNPPPFHRTLSDHCLSQYPGQERDIDLLARAVGVPNGVFRNVYGATEARDDGEGTSTVLAAEQYRAGLMNEALWPATWGYFLLQMMDPVLSNNKAGVEEARAYFRSYVRGRGPVPAFRIGSVPYGVLPAISLTHWEKRGTTPNANLEGKLVGLLRILREHWKTAATGASRIDPGATRPYDTLLHVLAQGASAQQIRIRNVQGKDTVANVGALLGQDVAAALRRMEDTANIFLWMVNQAQWADARMLRMQVSGIASVFPDPLVTAEGMPSPTQYIRGLLNATVEELKNDTVFAAGSPKPLLYMLVRHALLCEYARAVRERGLLRGTEIELWFLSIVIDDKRLFTILTQDLLNDIKAHEAFSYRDYLSTLADELSLKPAAEVERIFTETLDTSAHRLDAWITAFATTRLDDIRLPQEQSRQKPAGSYLGGYAWVENVRTAQAGAANGGFIHAPSMPQAAAAALLRSGFQSGQLEAKSKYAIDLSSERVRTGRRLLDEIREGQPLGAVLGYRFERALRERNLAQMEKFIAAFRKLYPLVANKSGQDPNQPADKVAARNVVDGLVTRTKFKDNLIPFGQQGLPGPNGTPEEKAAHAAIVDELNKLDGVVDAVGDLITAESVYQVVRGNVAAAGANLDALARGLQPPDPEIARSPRGGVGVTHRVALAWDDDLGDPTGWFSSTDATKYSQRRIRAGQLDNFLGRLMGNVSSVKATVTYKTASNATQNVEVFLGPQTDPQKKFLAVRPIDVVALARAATRPNEGSLLDRRIRDAALSGVSGFKDVTIAYDPGALTFPQVLEMARAIGTAFAGSRPLIPDDLLLPGESSGDAPLVPGEGAQALLDSANAARTRMDQDNQELKDAVQVLFEDLEEDGDLDDPALVDDLRDALAAAAAYAPTAFPDPADTPQQLVTAGNEIAAELDRRSTAAKAALDAVGGSSSEVSRTAIAALQSIFGRDFITTAAFTTKNQQELKLSLDSDLLGPTNKHAPAQMLEQMARVRDNLSRVRRVALYAEALATERPGLKLMQLPFVKGELWAGPRKGATPPERGRVSFAMLVPTGAAVMDPTGLTEGLMIDEWVELVPAEKEETGVAFHYDNPGAEAPQAVLVAVPPKANGKWTFAQLLATVDETFDLARIRVVEREQLPSEQALPVTYISHNLDNAVPSTDFARLANDPVIIE
jgi:hypothetical protein